MTMEEQRAWYLRATPSQVARQALLVGDRGRVERIAARLERPEFINDDRGLLSVTGEFRGLPVTAAAFGMGAPIASIVLHELFSIGTTTFLRLGTVMRLGDGELGEILLAEAAIRGEATSGTYVPDGYPGYADYELQTAVRRELEASGQRWRAGLYASYDGFYTEMLALHERNRPRVRERVQELLDLGVLGIDMETSAVLTVGRALGARAASLCLATVSGDGDRMPDPERVEAEERLVDIGLRALKTFADERAALEKGSTIVECTERVPGPGAKTNRGAGRHPD